MEAWRKAGLPLLLLLSAALLVWCAPEAGTCRRPGTCGASLPELAEESALIQVQSKGKSVRVETRGGEQAATCGDPARVYDCSADTSSSDDDAWGTPTAPAPSPYPVSCPAEDTFPWCNTALNSEDRAKLLVKEMNLTELAAQVSCDIFGGVPAIDHLGVNAYNYIRENDHGLLWNDVCPMPTMFPQVIVLGSTWNRTLITAIGKAAAIEARYNFDEGKQNSLFLQTNFNIFLDPRWGRGQEVPGECPIHTSEYARAWGAGVQAPEGPGGVPLAGLSCKHFTAYSFEGAGGWPYPAMDDNRHNFNAVVPEVDLVDTHYPMYQACAQFGAMGMMTSYNAVNGIPMAANGNLTNGLAREKWGFKGSVVTDCGAVEDIWLRHKYVRTGAEAARAALQGGTDIECGNTIFTDGAKKINEPLLRQSVEHSFYVRMELGEFNPPQGEPGGTMYDQAAHAQLAFDAAVQGSTLLRNDKDSVLPLSQGVRLALLGPLKAGNWELLGSYSGYLNSGNWTDSPNVVTIRQGLENCGMVGELIDPQTGPFVCSPTDQLIAGTNTYTEEPNADVAVIAIGLNCQDPQVQNVDARPEQSGKCQAGCLESEGCDRPGLQLPRGQLQLLERAAKWKIPVVVVVVSGGPLDLSVLDKRKGPTAILWAGYPGQQGGIAIAHMLFGLQSPSGKLSQTWYKSSYAEMLSIKDMHMRPSGDYPGRSYRFVSEEHIAFPFGYGLSYNAFEYKFARPGPPSPPEVQYPFFTDVPVSGFDGCSIALTVELSKAVGANPSETTMLFMVPPKNAGPLAPVKELRRFEKVLVKASTPATVQFDLTKKDFLLADARGAYSLVEGEWLAEVNEPGVL